MCIRDRNNFDLAHLDFGLMKNNTWVQQGNTHELLFDFDTLIVEASKYFTLKKGDLIFTGTPKGVGQIISKDILSGYLNQKKVFEVSVL